MSWQDRLNAAIDYLESCLETEVDWTEAARRANCSVFHFLRIFEVVTGLGAAEYLRRRRLSLAARELSREEVKVIDLALRLGYDSPDSFAKAFKRQFGLSPSEARRPGAALTAYGRLSVALVLKGNEAMEYRIEERESFELIGPAIRSSALDERNHRDIPAFWARLGAAGTLGALERAARPGSRLGVCGACVCESEDGSFDYLIGVEAERGVAGLEPCWRRVPVAAGTWGIFPSRGPLPEAIQAVWKRILEEWLPGSGWELADGAQLEIYPEGDTRAPDYLCEVWLPLATSA